MMRYIMMNISVLYLFRIDILQVFEVLNIYLVVYSGFDRTYYYHIYMVAEAALCDPRTTNTYCIVTATKTSAQHH